jgi:hypothetical protein
MFWVGMVLLFLAGYTKHVLTLSTGPTVLVNDAREYWTRGGRIADGDWLQREEAVNYRTPLYPLLIAGCRRVFGPYALFALAVIQHVLQLATGLITAAICWGISGKRWVTFVGYAMSVLCMTRPWYANVVLTETLFVHLMTVSFAALVAYHLRPSTPRAAAFGAALALAILTRPIPKYLWLPLLGLFFLHAVNRTDRRRIAGHVLMAGCALTAVLLPWGIRNAVVFDEATVASVPPINKWVVCFHAGSAANLPIPDSPAGRRLVQLLPRLTQGNAEIRDGYRVIARLRAAGLRDADIDNLISAVCIDAIREHPQTFGWKTFKRFVNYWRCSVKPYPFYAEYPRTGAGDYDGQVRWRWEPLASWYESWLRLSPSQQLHWLEFDSLLCGVGTLLLIARRPTRAIGLSLAAIFLYFSIVTAALEIECYRYRLVLDPCLIVASVCGLLSGDSWKRHPFDPGAQHSPEA